MLNQYEKAAYQGKPPPDDLSTDERVKYLLLRQVYDDFRHGTIDKQTGEMLKGFILLYPDLSVPNKAGLLACGYGSMQAAGCPEAIEMKGFWQAAHKEKLQQNQSISRMESEKENLSLFYQKTVNFPSTLSKTLAMKNDL